MIRLILIHSVETEVISPVTTFGKYSEDQLKQRYQNLLNILGGELNLQVRAVEWDKMPVVEGPSSFLYKIRVTALILAKLGTSMTL